MGGEGHNHLPHVIDILKILICPSPVKIPRVCSTLSCRIRSPTEHVHGDLLYSKSENDGADVHFYLFLTP